MSLFFNIVVVPSAIPGELGSGPRSTETNTAGPTIYRELKLGKRTETNSRRSGPLPTGVPDAQAATRDGMMIGGRSEEVRGGRGGIGDGGRSRSVSKS